MLARSRPFRSAECDEPFPPPLAGEGRASPAHASRAVPMWVQLSVTKREQMRAFEALGWGP
jgi:hypothetical protein